MGLDEKITSEFLQDSQCRDWLFCTLAKLATRAVNE